MKALVLTLMLGMTMVLCGGLAHAQLDPMMPGGMPMPGGPGGPRGGAAGARPGGGNDLRSLQAQLADEQKILDQIEDELRQDFEKDPEWQEAQKAQEQAQAEHDAARQAALEKVYEMPEYKTALDKKFAAESALHNLTASGSEVEPEQLQAASNALMEATGAVRKLEDDALAADPAVAESKQKLADANAALNELRKKFKESLELNADYLDQSDRVEDLKFKLAEARQRNADQMRQKSNANRKTTPSKPKRKSGGPSMGGPGGY